MNGGLDMFNLPTPLLEKCSLHCLVFNKYHLVCRKPCVGDINAK